MTKSPQNIGDTLSFKTPKGEALTGTIEGRAWFGDWVQSYDVRTPEGHRYTVNTSGESGHRYA